MEKDIIHEIISTTNLIRRNRIEKDFKNENKTTIMQDLFQGMIYKFQIKGTKIYQKDLEEHFSLRRSTSSEILALMEENGLITRQKESDDKRLKSIILTESALKTCKEREKEIKAYSIEITSGLTEEELSCLSRALGKIKENIKKLSEESEDKK